MKFWHLALLSAAALAVAACENKQPQPTAHQEAPPATTTAEQQPVTLDPYATDPYASNSAPPPRDPGTTSKAPAKGSKGDTLIAGQGGRKHTVQKGDTLYSLARKYYNDPKRWKDIWEANKGAIPDKDRLRVGTELMIP